MTDGLRDRVASAARELAEAGLFIGTAGNLSAVDPDSGLIAVTATGVTLAHCTGADVSVVDHDGTLVAGTLEPTSELDLHLGVLAVPGVGAVVHTHAPAATAVDDRPDPAPAASRIGGSS